MSEQDPAQLSGVPLTLLRMVEALSSLGRSELHRRLRIELAPTQATPERRRVAELGALAALLASHGRRVTRITPGTSMPELHAQAEQRAAERRAGRAAQRDRSQSARASQPFRQTDGRLDAETDFRAHHPLRPENPAYESYELRPAGWRRRPAPLETPPPVQQWRMVDQSLYDQLRAPDAPSASELASRYGSWPRACRAADGLLPDGRYTGIGLPWVNTRRDQTSGSAYTEQEITEAIRACAHALLTRPSSHQYLNWRAARRTAARDRGTPPPRLPSHSAIVKHFGSYPAAQRAAAISDEELASARVERAGLAAGELPGSPRARLARLPPAQTAELGLDTEMVEALTASGFGELPLDQAVKLAATLSGSLDWLAGRTPATGAPPAGTESRVSVDRERVRELRARAGVTDAALRTFLGLPTGPWRRLLNATRIATLDEVARIANALGVPIDEIVRSDHTGGGPTASGGTE